MVAVQALARVNATLEGDCEAYRTHWAKALVDDEIRLANRAAREAAANPAPNAVTAAHPEVAE